MFYFHREIKVRQINCFFLFSGLKEFNTSENFSSSGKETKSSWERSVGKNSIKKGANQLTIIYNHILCQNTYDSRVLQEKR